MTPFSEDSLLKLSELASARNQEFDITGYLYFRDGHFMQYLEGPQKMVESLLRKIEKDPRHQIRSTISLPQCKERTFPLWYMRYLGNDLPHRQAPALEDELAFILETALQENYRSQDVADAIIHVTKRIAGLDW